MLSPKEKAKKIVEAYKQSTFLNIALNPMSLSLAKQCALICVDEIIEIQSTQSGIDAEHYLYYLDVKHQIRVL